MPEPLKALDLIEMGDSAPNGRFTYRYTANVDIDPNQPPIEGGAGGKSNGGAGSGGAINQPGGTDTGGGATSAGVSGAAATGPAPAASADDPGCACRVAGFAPAGRQHQRVAGSLGFVAVLWLALRRRRALSRLC